MSYEIRDDFAQHVRVEATYSDGSIHSVLLVGTSAQIADNVRDTVNAALKYGRMTDLHIQPISPMNVVKLP